MRILSIDIGVHNTTFYCQDIPNPKSIKFPCKKLPKTKRIIKGKGLPTPEYKKLLDCIYSCGSSIYLENNDFAPGVKFSAKEKYKSENLLLVFKNINKYLDSLYPLLKTCDIILIEKQMKTNYLAQRLEQHFWSWFLIKLTDDKKTTEKSNEKQKENSLKNNTKSKKTRVKIIIYPSTNKTSALGAPKSTKGKKNKPLRKKWCISECTNILEKKKKTSVTENIVLGVIKRSKKKDDLSDAICQLESFKVKLLFDGKDE